MMKIPVSLALIFATLLIYGCSDEPEEIVTYLSSPNLETLPSSSELKFVTIGTNFELARQQLDRKFGARSTTNGFLIQTCKYDVVEFEPKNADGKTVVGKIIHKRCDQNGILELEEELEKQWY